MKDIFDDHQQIVDNVELEKLCKATLAEQHGDVGNEIEHYVILDVIN